MPISVKYLQEYLNAGYKKLELVSNGNAITADDAKVIADELGKNPALEELDLSHCFIKDEGAEALAGALERNTHLTRLSLNGCDITDKGAKAIAEGLAKNRGLNRLSLYSNRIGDEGAERLAAALRSNTTLQGLTLDYNHISETGAHAIADAIRVHPLKSLGLGGNMLGDEGAVVVAEAGGNLRSLTLFKNDISDTGAKAVAKHLFAAGKLESLDISSNDIGTAGAVAMAQTLPDSNMLSLLACNNTMGGEGVLAFGKALQAQDRITVLLLNDNNAGRTAKTQFITQLKEQPLLNLLTVTPSDDKLEKMCTANKETAMALCQAFQEKQEQPVSFRLKASRRLQAMHNLADRSSRLGPDVMHNVTASLAEIPPMPDRITSENLLQSNDQGLTPLDNPSVWEKPEEILPVLDKTALLYPNREGTPFLQNAVLCGKLALVLEALNKKGERLTATDLLTPEGVSLPLLSEICVERQVGALFSLDNWFGQPPEDMLKVYRALPAEGKAQVHNLNALRQSLQQGQNPAQVSGRGR